MLIRFLDWFIKPLGYRIVPTDQYNRYVDYELKRMQVNVFDKYI